ncbi:hypothetical protein [Roseateles chitinivorans]|uniref:hypothetical protein n=1 Tax=Roseateles chitinivorans TaxID=2917965 RepID=UPI003D669709
MLKFLLTILKYACPLLVAAQPIIGAVGVIAPWSVAQEALGPVTARDAVLISGAYRGHSSGTVTRERREQTYVVLPTLKTITVIEEDGQVRTEEEAYGLVGNLVSYSMLCFGTWWFWFRKRSTARDRRGPTRGARQPPAPR